ncbi:MAG: ARMT1-like domain-containing protein [Proteiniphilum sp.]|nr:ARMT1-like domain-containing protein [Proteiniphilum sp.]
MEADYRCYFCFARTFERLIEKQTLTAAEKKALVAEMFSHFHNGASGFSVPVLSKELYRLFREKSGVADPYEQIKYQSNERLLGEYAMFREMIDQSDDPFETALRLAVAGNIIDYGVSDQYDLEGTIARVLESPFAINHVRRLRRQLAEARTVLYLGDNAGEIVFDKLFIETFRHPNLWYAVRGAPVINDATLKDAAQVRMEEVAQVIDNGYDAPSTLPEKCSPAFQQLYNEADLVISKGQGNLEGLINAPRGNIYSLLMVKCDVIADSLGVTKGSFVCVGNEKKMSRNNEDCNSEWKGGHR